MSALLPGAVSPGRTRSRAVGVVAGCWLSAAAAAVAALATAPDGATVAVVVIVAAVALVPLVCGALLARRLPSNPAGPLTAAAGLALVVTNAPGDRLPTVLSGAWMLLYVPFAVLLVIVPAERPRTAWDGRAAIALPAVAAAFILSGAAQEWLPQAHAVLTPAAVVLLAGFAGLLIVCVSAPARRYRRAGERERLRLRWVFLAGMSLPAALLLCWASYLTVGGPDLVVFGLIVAYTAVPLGVAIALVRPEAYDVDRATVVTTAGVVTGAAVLAVLSAVSGAVGLAMAHWSPAAAVTATVLSTLAAATTFPWVQRGVVHALYPERAVAMRALKDLTARVDAGSAMPESVQDVLRAALRDPGLVVAIRHPAETGFVDLTGAPVADGDGVPVRMRGETIGAVVGSTGQARPPADAVRGCAALVDAVRSRAVLARAMSEVEASRRRLLRAGYDQRRRLERDLHDGVLQRLVALGMRLRVLQRNPSTDPVTAGMLDAVVAELGETVVELRNLAHGVRPSALDDGLAAAVTELVDRTDADIDVDLDVGDVPDLVALTAYYVVSEALTNVLRHAAATRIRIDVRAAADALHVVVRDDGRGGAARLPTGGLTGLADRVAALGGRMRVHSPAGAGTRVEAVLPCGS